MKKRVGTGNATANTGARTVAKASAPPPTFHYRSKLEAAYANVLHVQMLAGEIALYRYEAIRLKLVDGVIYVPDFYILMPDGRHVFHEVKGYSKGMMARPGMIKFKVAASTWPHWSFVLVTRSKGIWNHQPW